MRVLYVAMTRAKDRLLMTYAVNKLDSDIQKLANQMDICNPELLTSGAHCPGTEKRQLYHGQHLYGNAGQLVHDEDPVQDHGRHCCQKLRR